MMNQQHSPSVANARRVPAHRSVSLRHGTSTIRSLRDASQGPKSDASPELQSAGESNNSRDWFDQSNKHPAPVSTQNFQDGEFNVYSVLLEYTTN